MRSSLLEYVNNPVPSPGPPRREVAANTCPPSLPLDLTRLCLPLQERTVMGSRMMGAMADQPKESLDFIQPCALSIYPPLRKKPSSHRETQQGKVAELRTELNSGGKKDKNHSAKKIALKKIVANMTMSNNDMVALFPDIVACMQIPSLEMKKMLVAWRPRVEGLMADAATGASCS